MAKKPPKKQGGKKKNNRQKKNVQRYKSATRNVQLEMQPQLTELDSMLQQIQQDKLQRDNAAQSIFGGANAMMNNQQLTDYGQISDDLLSRLGTLSGMYTGGVNPSVSAGSSLLNPGEIPVAMPEAEQLAGQGLGQAIGAGSLGALSAFGAREGAAQDAAIRANAIAQQNARGQNQQEMQDALQTYRNQRSNLMAQMPSMIDRERDQLRQEAIERKLANSQIRGDKAFSDYLQDMLGNQIGGPTGGRPGGGGRGGGGGMNRGATRSGFGGGPGGGIAGQGPTDTGVGGNRGPGRAGGQYGGTETGLGGNTFQPQIPNAWRNAGQYSNLPPVLQNVYQRPSGTSKMEAFRQSPHPSFDNFRDFQSAYQQFLPRINRLYRRQYGPGQWQDPPQWPR